MILAGEPRAIADACVIVVVYAAWQVALLGRLRLRPRLPEWIVWHVMALAGVVLALGGNTPVALTEHVSS